MKTKISVKKILFVFLLLTLSISIKNDVVFAQTTVETHFKVDTTSMSQIEKVWDSVEGILGAIVGILILFGGIVYLIITKAKVLFDFFPKLIRNTNNLNEPVFYDNYNTIIKYLKSKNWDQYNTAFTYILHHNEFPQKVIQALTKIILKERPFNSREWITDKERIKASQHLCFVLKKNVQKLNGHDGISFCNVDTMLKSNANPG